MGARTPEELDILLEDAFLTRDTTAMAALFQDGAVLVADGDAHGPNRITHAVTAMWDRDDVYVADPQQVIQAGDTALVIASRSVSVMRRDHDGTWRYVIALLAFDGTHTTRE